ncbi:MAG: acyl-CoA dehydrogenase family protein [Gammaproteobacteria bacterium]|nr:acyl-CoA dehydrogenase family protein [Gammaproteobacteria bacterium]
MNDVRRLIIETTDRIMTDMCTRELVDHAEQGEWPDQLWQTLEVTGLTLTGISEAAGGSGGELADALAVIRQAARYAAPLPLAETFMAAVLLEAVKASVPSGPLTVVSDPREFCLARIDHGYRLSGRASGVPWAGECVRIMLLAGDGKDARLITLRPDQCVLESANNIAGEPRYQLQCDAVELGEDQIFALPELWNFDRLFELGALTRSVMMAGALDSILDLCVQYVQERQQFGRPIAKFQAIQQQLAALAGQVAASSKAADIAAETYQTGSAAMEIAAAKSRIGEAAGISAEIAHQVHGAMGFTHEHSLHHRTRRLWAWRDEYGTESYWQERLGRNLCSAGTDNLWSALIKA